MSKRGKARRQALAQELRRIRQDISHNATVTGRMAVQSSRLEQRIARLERMWNIPESDSDQTQSQLPPLEQWGDMPESLRSAAGELLVLLFQAELLRVEGTSVRAVNRFVTMDGYLLGIAALAEHTANTPRTPRGEGV